MTLQQMAIVKCCVREFSTNNGLKELPKILSCLYLRRSQMGKVNR